MGWPQLIQLHNSEYSHSYDGSEIRETWYIEPYDSITAFVAAMLGRVDPNGIDNTGNPNPVWPLRTMPAGHFLYPWCLAVCCDVVPYDPRSFSYMGSTYLAAQAAEPPGNVAPLQNLARISLAVSAYGRIGPHAANEESNLDPTAHVDMNFVSQANRQYSAGAFVCVTYKPIMYPASQMTELVGSVPPSSLDLANLALVAKLRDNIPNAGLRLVTGGLLGTYPPSAGIAPVFKEEYQEVVIERRMLLPTFNHNILSSYVNCVNSANEQLVNVGLAGMFNPLSFVPGTLRFAKYATEYVQVPQVNRDGEPAGFNRWMNLQLRYDWRTMLSTAVHGANGALIGTNTFITWNHVLAYPGLLLSVIGGNNLGWYISFYLAAAFGGVALPFPPVTVGHPGGAILDPLKLNW